MALAHKARGLHFVFRIARHTSPGLDAFIASPDTDRTVTLEAPRCAPALRGRTCRLRLVQYTDAAYCLATSLVDRHRYPVHTLSDLDHGRWGVEEFYKTGEAVPEPFHARSERGVRQELYTAFILVTLARQFANRCDSDLNDDGGEPATRANFQHGLRLVGREIEAMFLRQSHMIAQSVRRIVTGLSRCIQRDRPGRSYPRSSRQPRSKWLRRAAA